MPRLGLNLPKSGNANMELMKERMAKMQEQLESIENKTYEGSSGSDAVKVTANGKLELVDIKISNEILGDKEALQDLFLVASNNALHQAIDEKEAISKSATEGLNINMDGLF